LKELTLVERVAGGKPVGELINQIASKYDFSNPAASISDLTKVYVMIQSLDENH
jgi:hypothetical protein